MAEQSKRTTLSFGGVKAEVALFKTSGKPSEAKHDVRWPEEKPSAALAPKHEAERENLETVHALERAAEGVDDEPLGRGSEDESPLFDRAEAAENVENVEPPKPRHGVALESGEFVDLTERLAEIDERTKLEGMEVVKTTPSASVPREWVRDAHWVGTADPRSAKVLALVGLALRATNRVAWVRWTKTKNQALGVLVMRKVGRDDALLLLELEWPENMRPPGPRVTGPMLAEVAPGEVGAAARLVEALAAGPGAVDELRDERLALRAELLTAVRGGGAGAAASVDSPPEPASAEEAEDLVAQWTAEAEAL